MRMADNSMIASMMMESTLMMKNGVKIEMKIVEIMVVKIVVMINDSGHEYEQETPDECIVG